MLFRISGIEFEYLASFSFATLLRSDAISRQIDKQTVHDIRVPSEWIISNGLFTN